MSYRDCPNCDGIGEVYIGWEGCDVIQCSECQGTGLINDKMIYADMSKHIDQCLEKRMSEAYDKDLKYVFLVGDIKTLLTNLYEDNADMIDRHFGMKK